MWHTVIGEGSAEISGGGLVQLGRGERAAGGNVREPDEGLNEGQLPG
jgi:hypothetical protein